MADGVIAVQGLRELSRAFKAADKKLIKEFRHELREAADPVAVRAEQLALQEIPRREEPRRSGIGPKWSRMRVGVTQQFVYVVPAQRGTKVARRKRPNLTDLLLDRAMEPALEQTQAEVVGRIDALLGTVGRTWEDV